MARELRVEIDGDSKGARKALDDVADESDKAALTLRGLAKEMKAAAREGGHLQDELKDVGGTAKVASDELGGVAKQADKAAKELDDTAKAALRLDASLAAARVEIDKLNKELAETGDVKVAKALEQQYREYDRIARIKKRILQQDEQAKPAVDPVVSLEKQYQIIDRTARLKKRIAKDEEDAYKENERRVLAAAKRAEQERRARTPVRSALKDLFAIVPGLGRLGASGASSGLSGLSDLSSAGGPIFSTITTAGLIAGGASAAVPALAAGGGALLGAGALGAVGGGIAGAAAQSAAVGDSFNTMLDKVEYRFKTATTSWIAPTVDAIHTLDAAIDQIPLESIFKTAEKYVEPLSKGFAGFITGATGGLDDMLKDAAPVIDKLSTALPKLGKSIGDAERILGHGGQGGADALGDILDLAGGLTQAFAAAVAGAGMLYKKLEDTPVFSQGHQLFMSLFDFKDLPETVARRLGGVADSEAEMARRAAEAKQRFDDLNKAFQDTISNALSSVEANVAYERAVDNLTEGFKRGKNALDASNETGRQNIELAAAIVDAAQRQRDAAIAAGDGSAVATAKANKAYESQIGFLEETLVKLGVARDKAHEFALQISGLDGMTATVKVNVKYQEYNPGIALGNLLHHARGGTAAESGPAVVGEHGPEIAWLNRQQYISTAEETRKLASMAGSASSGSATAAPWTLLVAAGADTLLGQMMQAAFDRRLVQVFDGGGRPVSTRRG